MSHYLAFPLSFFSASPGWFFALDILVGDLCLCFWRPSVVYRSFDFLLANIEIRSFLAVYMWLGLAIRIDEFNQTRGKVRLGRALSIDLSSENGMRISILHPLPGEDV